jgi:TATA-binding protein-associated factor Taf7
MKKTRLLTGLLALALALATAPAVMAQDESAAPEAAASAEPFDPASVPEFQEDEALAAYLLFRDTMLTMGVAEGDLAEATAYLEGEAQAEMTDEADEVAEEVTEAEEEVQDEKDEVQDEKDEVQDEKDEAKKEVEEAKDKVGG